MTGSLLNRPTFQQPVSRNVVIRRAQAKSARTIYRTFSENALDRLRLIAAAERYEGSDWRKFREI